MTDNRRVVPAILTDDASALARMTSQAEQFASYVQFDIMDGLFVPSRSIDARHIASLHPNFTWEAHLMVVHPEERLAEFKQAGASKVAFHYEATDVPLKVIDRARGLGVGVGLAINPDTPVAAIASLVEKVDSVLFLSVVPGFYGSKFIPAVLDKIRDFRRLQPGVLTGIDGGVKAANLKEIAATGVHEICVGSAIFAAPDPAIAYHQLSEALAGKPSPGRPNPASSP